MTLISANPLCPKCGAEWCSETRYRLGEKRVEWACGTIEKTEFTDPHTPLLIQSQFCIIKMLTEREKVLLAACKAARDCIAKHKVPQDTRDAAMQVVFTMGPVLAHLDRVIGDK